MSAGRQAGFRVEIPAMPGTAQHALAVLAFFDRTFAQRAALVRAAILHRVVFTIYVGKSH